MMTQQSISLTQFAQRVAYLINGRTEVTRCWVIAELSDFRMHGVHAYGQLIEKNPAGQTISTLRATIWQRDLAAIRRKFIAATGQDIRSGMKVSLCISATFHPAYGLSANISDIDPTYSLGDMERIRREILEQLKREGIFDINRATYLTPNPQRIAVISAEGAAGYGDFMRQIESSGFAIYPILFPAAMQGERTVPTILAALDKIEETIDLWDCVVIIRGGGATNDLNSFDNLELARRVATFSLPIIVGIGHERDNTVLDYIAHTRCKTPTAVAAFLIDTLSLADQRAEMAIRKVMERASVIISSEKQHLSHLSAMLPILAPNRISAEAARLDNLRATLAHAASRHTASAASRISEIAAAIGRNAATAITRAQTNLSIIPDRIGQVFQMRQRMESTRLDSIAELLKVLSPEATLRRGYTITRINGRAIRSAAECERHPQGTELTTILPDGSLHSILLGGR